MTSIDFPQANATFGPPSDLVESQCAPARAFCGQVERGSLEGCKLVVTAWQPTPDELRQLSEGSPLFLTFVGGLPPHFVSTRFEEATNPA